MTLCSEKTYSFKHFSQQLDVKLGFGVYSENNSLAVVLMCRAADLYDDLREDDDYYYDDALFDEVYGIITVNLDNSGALPWGAQYIDINNFPQITNWLIENHIAIPTSRTYASGSILYPAYRFLISSDLAKKLEYAKQ